MSGDAPGAAVVPLEEGTKEQSATIRDDKSALPLQPPTAAAAAPSPSPPPALPLITPPTADAPSSGGTAPVPIPAPSGSPASGAAGGGGGDAPSSSAKGESAAASPLLYPLMSSPPSAYHPLDPVSFLAESPAVSVRRVDGAAGFAGGAAAGGAAGATQAASALPLAASAAPAAPAADDSAPHLHMGAFSPANMLAMPPGSTPSQLQPAMGNGGGGYGSSPFGSPSFSPGMFLTNDIKSISRYRVLTPHGQQQQQQQQQQHPQHQQHLAGGLAGGGVGAGDGGPHMSLDGLHSFQTPLMATHSLYNPASNPGGGGGGGGAGGYASMLPSPTIQQRFLSPSSLDMLSPNTQLQTLTARLNGQAHAASPGNGTLPMQRAAHSSHLQIPTPTMGLPPINPAALAPSTGGAAPGAAAGGSNAATPAPMGSPGGSITGGLIGASSQQSLTPPSPASSPTQQLAAGMNSKQLMAALSNEQMHSQHQQAQHLQSQQQVTQLQLQLQIQMQLSQQLQAQLQLQQAQLQADSTQLQQQHLQANSAAYPSAMPPQAYPYNSQQPQHQQQQAPLGGGAKAPFHPNGSSTLSPPQLSTQQLQQQALPMQPQQQHGQMHPGMGPQGQQQLPPQMSMAMPPPQMQQHQQQQQQQQQQESYESMLKQHHLLQQQLALTQQQQHQQQHYQPLTPQPPTKPAPTVKREQSEPKPKVEKHASAAATGAASTVPATPSSAASGSTGATVRKRERDRGDGADSGDEGAAGGGGGGGGDDDSEGDSEGDSDKEDGGSKAGDDDAPVEFDAEGNPLPKKKRVAGSSCHQCKTRREGDELIRCGMSHAKKGRAKKRKQERKCRKKYCNRCLLKFYNEPAPAKPPPGEPNTWSCPGCRGLCTCAACKRTQIRREIKRKKLAAQQAAQQNPPPSQLYASQLHAPPSMAGGMGGLHGYDGSGMLGGMPPLAPMTQAQYQNPQMMELMASQGMGPHGMGPHGMGSGLSPPQQLTTLGMAPQHGQGFGAVPPGGYMAMQQGMQMQGGGGGGAGGPYGAQAGYGSMAYGMPQQPQQQGQYYGSMMSPGAMYRTMAMPPQGGGGGGGGAGGPGGYGGPMPGHMGQSFKMTPPSFVRRVGDMGQAPSAADGFAQMQSQMAHMQPQMQTQQQSHLSAAPAGSGSRADLL